MYILGINGDPLEDCHDCSAALVKDGKLIAAAEQERFSHRKHAYGEVPLEAINFVLKQENISLNDIDIIASSWLYNDMPSILPAGIDTTYSLKTFPKAYFKYDKIPQIRFVSHHLSHICSSFYQSGFSEAACIVIDGQGEKESITLAHINQDQIEILKTYSVSCSLGALYDAASCYCGLGYDVPGKLMGLAPYGKPDQDIPLKFEKKSATFTFNNINIIDSDDFITTREKYIKYFINNNYPYCKAPFAAVKAEELMSYINFAASIQKSVADIIIGLAEYLKSQLNTQNLILAGGVALNCTTNGVLDRLDLFPQIYIFPAANDAGGAVGAALEVAREYDAYKFQIPNKLNNSYLGQEFTNEEIESFLNNINFNAVLKDNNDLVKTVANKISKGQVIAWFNGRAEFGPRALGARSFLANPTKREQLIKLNRIKQRELWRPLSPVIIDELYDKVFDDPKPDNMTAFMLKTCKIKSEWWNLIPAVVHIDNTSRPQILKKEDNELLYSLLKEIYDSYGIPLIINTSLNIKGQPIVNNPRDALILFENQKEIDTLIMGNWVIKRKGI